MIRIPAGFTRITVAILLLFPGSLGIAQVPAFPADSGRDLVSIFVNSGRVPPSASFPYSGSFLRDSTMSLPADTVIPTLQDVPVLDAGFATNYERYIRPDNPLPFADYLQDVDPLFTLQLAYQVDLGLALYVEAIGIREYRFGMGPDNWPPSEEGDPFALENNMVRQGYLYLRQGPIELTFGRQHVSIGPSPFTSIAVSPTIPFLDALDVIVNLGPLRMTLLLSTLENRKASGDVLSLPPDYTFGKTVILYNTHYFEWDFRFLRAGIGSSVVITRPDNAFQISDFFPVFSWHNANIKPNNLSLFFDITAVPTRGLELYGQFGFDDINANLFGSNDSGIPTIGAGLFGAEWFGGWDRFPLRAAAEIGYTHYLWGSYNESIPLARAIYRMDLDENNHWLPLTSPFGPGAAWIIAELGLETPWKLSSTFSFQLVSRNTSASLTGPYEANPAIRDAPRALSLRTSLRARYEPFPWLKATVEPALLVDGGDVWMELDLGIAARIGGTWDLASNR